MDVIIPQPERKSLRPNGKTEWRRREEAASHYTRSSNRITKVSHHPSVLLIFKSLFARDGFHHAAFGMNALTVALEAAIRAVRIDRPLIVTL